MNAKVLFIFVTTLIICPNLSFGAKSCVQAIKTRPEYRLVYRQGTSQTGVVYNSEIRMDYLIKSTNEEIVGDFFGTFDKDSDTYDFYFSINPFYRRIGISQRLLTKFFIKFPPNKKVRSSLIFTNLEVFENELGKNGDEWTSAKETPFVRAFSGFGYNLTEVSYTPEGEDDILLVTLSPTIKPSSSALD